MKAPFDHAPYDVEDIEKDKVDRRRGERVSPKYSIAPGKKSKKAGFRSRTDRGSTDDG